MVKLHLDVSNVIHVNEHTKHGLHVNFWNYLLMPFYFMIKKDNVKLLLWPQIPFKNGRITFWNNTEDDDHQES